MSIATSVTTNDYKVGRGEIYFGAFVPGGAQIPGPEIFLGDCMALSASIKATQVDHYGSTGGVKIVDQSATVQADSTGSLTTEDISTANLALFFFGTSSIVTQTTATITAEVIPATAVIKGGFIQLGYTAANPVGNRGIDPATPIVVKDATGVTTYTVLTDYQIDYALGRLYIMPSGAITSAAGLQATYHTLAGSRPRVISGQTPIEGALRFVSANTVGTDKDWYMPWVKITPNGNVELIGDKFASLQFDLKLLAKAGLGFLYIDGRVA